MIRLVRDRRPHYLTSAKEASLAAKFISDKSITPWNSKTIRTTLERMSNKKCAYCEVPLGTLQSMQVDHYEPKSRQPGKVMKWDNFVPSCGKCNREKLDYDTGVNPIVNPFNVDPRDHLRLHAYMFSGITSMGVHTEACLNLSRLDEQRFQIVNPVVRELKTVREISRSCASGILSDPSSKRAMTNGLKSALRRCRPGEIFSSTMATMILSSPDYRHIRSDIVSCGAWDFELDELEKGALKVAYL